jgi:hypothetical protein
MRHIGRRQPEAVAEPSGGLGEMLARRQAGGGVVLVVVVALVAGGLAWQRFGPDVRGGSEYVLTADRVSLDGQPAWVKSDIVAEALRDASLDGRLPLDDPELARRLARAFDVHPWVRSVDRVEVLSPASARVTITCREPVAMVRVSGGLLPVDIEGVVLPSDGFTTDDAAQYPVIDGVTSLPLGPAGAAWGDKAVEEAVAVVAVTKPEWPLLDLVECRREGTTDQRRWKLINTAGVAITFGCAPGHEDLGEPGMAEKIAALKRLAAKGPVEQPVDLRELVAETDESSLPRIDSGKAATDDESLIPR